MHPGAAAKTIAPGRSACHIQWRRRA